MNSQISKEKSNETDDFISFISEKKSSLSKKDDSSSNFVSILQSGNNSKISQKESNSEFVSAIEYDESLKKVSESSVETVQIVSQATKTIEDEQSNSENDLFIFQSPVNNKQRAKIARPNMHSSEISGEQVELNGLRNIPLVITKKKKDNISISNEKIIKTIDRVARVDEETPRRKHRHHHHKSSDSETVPCIPRALQRSMLNSKNEKAKESPVKKLFFSNAVPFSTEDEEIKSNKVAQKKVKLSISMPLDVKDIIADEVEVTEMSASSIVSDEIPKPTILSFSSENELPKPKERKKKATLSFCNAANDIPPETSPTRNRLTHRSPKSKTEITSSKPSVYRTSTSSFSYLQPSYTLEPSSQIDTNYLNTIQSAKLQLASIQNSINISRQKRAMQESRLSQFKYTKNPFRA